MSFILDALRKAERDRNLGQVPGLQDMAMASAVSADAARSRSTLRLVVLAVLALIASIAAYLLFRPHATPTAPAATSTAPAPLPAGVVTARVRGPAVLPEPSAPVPATVSAAAESVPAPPAQVQTDGSGDTNTLEETSEAPPAIGSDEMLTSLDDLTEAEAAPTEAVVTAPAGPAAAPPTDADKMQAAIQAAIEAAETAPSTAESPDANAATDTPSDAILLDNMPASYRATFPSFEIQVHVWDSDSAKRFVLIDGRRYRDGDTLAAGPKLVRIAQQGLVLDYSGQRVLLSIAQ
jgi:general secretion pathway protein B